MQSRALFSSVFVLAFACAHNDSSDSTPTQGVSPTDPGDPNAGPAAQKPEPPHALGVLTLSEAHASGQVYPGVLASFAPNTELVDTAKKAKSCTRQIDGCELPKVLKCATACKSGETCTFNDACEPSCVVPAAVVPTCTAKSCQSTAADPYRFDAGALWIRGAESSALTLFPPYAFTAAAEETAPFLPGEEIHVVATGAKEAGFAAFDAKFAATSYLESVPPLASLKRAAVFGKASLDLGWAAGKDSVQITLTGNHSAAKCAADDTTGNFIVSRAVIDALVFAPEDTVKTAPSALSISLTRTRTETRKDLLVFGNLERVRVENTGWLELTTTSSESASISPCAATQTECGGSCVDLQTDSSHCGTCTTYCGTGAYCRAGTCQ